MKDLRLFLMAGIFAAASSLNFDADPSAHPSPRVPMAHDGLDATLWLQVSAERDAICKQLWMLAQTRLEESLHDPSWSGALEQGPFALLLPPAVIVDIDETVLDNSPYQARLILDGENYAPKS